MVARAMQADRKAAMSAKDELRREKLARDYATEQWRNEEKARRDLDARVRYLCWSLVCSLQIRLQHILKKELTTNTCSLSYSAPH